MDKASETTVPHWWNVPNQVTAVRMVLSVVVFALVTWQYFLSAFAVFVVAVSTDWIDGYWARKYGQVTKVGRIFDPFVDKLIICGIFIYLATLPASGIGPAIAVIVVARELLVTALRGVVEGSGGDFSANQAGKWKMVVQCLAAGASLLTLHFAAQSPQWLLWTRDIATWLAVAITLYSGGIYVNAAARMLRARPLS